jgi:GNAT superfamily N-acetyltransferase
MNTILISQPEPELLNDIISINIEYFSHAEQTNNALNVPKEIYRNYAEHITMKASGEGQLLVARKNDSVVGYLIWEKVSEPLVTGMKTNKEVYKLIAPELAFVELLEAEFKKKYNIPDKECARLMQAAVLPEEQNKGIATSLVRRAIEDIRNKNYNYIIADCTADNSWRILLKFDFKIVCELTYSDFEYAGSNPFKKLKGKRRLVIKEL